MPSLCVYSSSSDAIGPAFYEAATELGREMAHQGYTLVYGGASVGLMGAVACAVKAHGGYVVGVIPETIEARGLAFAEADELIVTRDLRERKAVMEARADAFVALPGGFGTLEEIMEVLTLKQLGLHQKPIVFLNVGGFYDPLLVFFDRIYAERCAKPESCQLYAFVPTVPALFEYLAHYRPTAAGQKWFDKGEI